MHLVSCVFYVIIFALLCFRFCTDDSCLSVISLNHYLLNFWSKCNDRRGYVVVKFEVTSSTSFPNIQQQSSVLSKNMVTTKVSEWQGPPFTHSHVNTLWYATKYDFYKFNVFMHQKIVTHIQMSNGIIKFIDSLFISVVQPCFEGLRNSFLIQLHSYVVTTTIEKSQAKPDQQFDTFM